MVAAEHVRKNLAVLHAVNQPARRQEIIDTPASVARARTADVAPPAIGLRLVRIEVAKGVDKSVLQQACHTGALLIRKPGVHAVGLGVLKVDLLMRYVEVAADDDWFLRVQRAEEV
ncbi:hypothetical protein SDC9_138409 [bioreactor metagenome]|uniref:Uncharacterized protein n=1 Tax=bioreactor metagenome TaxID=1076179 RepID=A0A645DPR1_9ZZZZ